MIEVNAQTAVLVLTDDGDDATSGPALAYASRVAQAASVPVILYDRSGETWFDSQHWIGPLEASASEVTERPHLVAQIDEVRRLGAQALAWLPSMPSLSGVVTAVQETGADVLVVAASMDQRLADKVGAGTDLAESAAAQFRALPDCRPMVVCVAEDGSAQLVDTDRTL